MHECQGSFSSVTQGESNQQREKVQAGQGRPGAWASEGYNLSPRSGTVGALGENHMRQEGGLGNIIPSCKMGTISDTGCGEDDEVMYVKCQQRFMVFLNVLTR